MISQQIGCTISVVMLYGTFSWRKNHRHLHSIQVSPTTASRIRKHQAVCLYTEILHKISRNTRHTVSGIRK